MDPLTHTLVGANLASTRLGGASRLAPAALIIGANLPDVDVLAFAVGGDAALGFRRGWTHGVLALVVLPLALTALLALWDRLRGDPRDDFPVHGARLLGVSALAVLTHPALDWLNTYGMRWLMPFRETWFYGDAVFIMDPWLWLVLGGAWLAGRRRSLPALVLWALFAGAVAWVVIWRAPSYLPAVAAVALALLGALLWSPRGSPAPLRRRLSAAGLTLAVLYILGMVALHGLTERRVHEALDGAGYSPVARLMAGPIPIDPFTWDVVAEVDHRYLLATWRWRDGSGLTLSGETLEVPPPGPLWETARRTPEVRGFMSWVRFPWIESEPGPSGIRVFIMDARYTRHRSRGFGGALVEIRPPDPSGSVDPPAASAGSETAGQGAAR